MKSLTINSLVLAVALWTTPSLAATELSGQPVNQSETDTHSVQAATSPAPFFALSGLDAQTLAAQEMTDQELKAVEGGSLYQTLLWGLYPAIADRLLMNPDNGNLFLVP